MADSVTQNIQKIEKLMVKLRNKIKRVDLDYTVQVSSNSTDPTKIMYAAQMTAPANGLAPVTFVDENANVIIENIKMLIKSLDYDAVEIAYHQAQIEACKRTIKGHEERLAELENKDSEEKTNNEESQDDSQSEVPSN